MAFSAFMRWLAGGAIVSTTVAVKRPPDSLRRAILEATPTDLRDIQAWLKERMDADWAKAAQQRKESPR